MQKNIFPNFSVRSIPENFTMSLTHFIAIFAPYKLIDWHWQEGKKEKLQNIVVFGKLQGIGVLLR